MFLKLIFKPEALNLHVVLHLYCLLFSGGSVNIDKIIVIQNHAMQSRGSRGEFQIRNLYLSLINDLMNFIPLPIQQIMATPKDCI